MDLHSIHEIGQTAIILGLLWARFGDRIKRTPLDWEESEGEAEEHLMAELTGNQVNLTYKGVLHVDNSNTGIDATLRTVEDGEGTDSKLQLSTAQVCVADTPGNHVAAPSLALGDGDSGLYEASDDVVVVAVGGVEIARYVKDATYANYVLADGVMIRYSGSVVLTDNDVINVATVTIATEDGFSGQLGYIIYCTDGTDMQSHSGTVLFAANNKSGTITTDVTHPVGFESEDLTGGTLSESWSFTDNGGGTASIKIQANTSLTPTTFYASVNMIVGKSSTGLVFS